MHMEFFEKYNWVAPISALISFSFVFYLDDIKFIKIPIFLVGIMVCLFYILPCMFRTIVCLKWKEAPAMVVSVEDRSRFHANKHGGVSFTILFEIQLEYVVHDKLFKGKIFKSDNSFDYIETLYYAPKNPNVYTYNKGMTLLSFVLIYDVFFLLIFGHAISLFID